MSAGRPRHTLSLTEPCQAENKRQSACVRLRTRAGIFVLVPTRKRVGKNTDRLANDCTRFIQEIIRGRSKFIFEAASLLKTDMDMILFSKSYLLSSRNSKATDIPVQARLPEPLSTQQSARRSRHHLTRKCSTQYGGKHNLELMRSQISPGSRRVSQITLQKCTVSTVW